MPRASLLGSVDLSTLNPANIAMEAMEVDGGASVQFFLHTRDGKNQPFPLILANREALDSDPKFFSALKAACTAFMQRLVVEEYGVALLETSTMDITRQDVEGARTDDSAVKLPPGCPPPKPIIII